MKGTKMLNQMIQSLNYNVSLLASQEEILGKPGDMSPRDHHEISIEDKRIAILQRNIYVEGVKVLHQQEQFGRYFTLFLSAGILLLLFFITRIS